jgi:membrane protein implicated in regulation of membrane protease activity
MVEIEGDFWTVRVEGTTHLEPGQAVVVTAFADQTPTVRVQAPS